MRAALPIAVLAVASLVAACSSPAASPQLSTASPSPARSPTSSTSPSTGPLSQPPATQPGTPSPAVSSSAAGFSCAYPYTLGGTASGTVSIVAVSVAAGDGFDRIVVTFDGDAIPPIRLDAVAPPFTSDPSGLPLSVPGRAFVRLTMSGASGVGTYAGPLELALDGRPLQAFVEQGDFEAVTTWIAGLASPSCLRVTTLANPTRLVIDLREP